MTVIFMRIGVKSQSSLEYLIVMGIAIFILGAAISYAIYYQVGYNSAGTSQGLQLAASSIANAINSISPQALGSSEQFSFTSPGLSLTSSICNDSLTLNFGGEEASQSLSLYTTGELPLTSGTYTGEVKLVNKNGKTQAELRMQLPISYISTSYTFNPSSVFYNVSFLDAADNLVGDINFTIIIYSNNKIVAEQNETSITGYYSGSVSPTGGQFSHSSVAVIYVRSLNIISPSCFLPQKLLIVPNNVLNYVPITIKNSQASSTPSPFQQEVAVDSADYQQYEASNLQNIEFFYPNGTIIRSWLESGNSNTATNTVYWLRLNGIQADSSVTVYMGFAQKSSNLFNTTNDGEAPQLSPTYAQYDDGANVFPILYQNFAGTALQSGWTGSGYTINDGLSLPYSSYAITTTNYGLNSEQILDFYGNFPIANSGDNAGFGYTLSGSAVTSSSSIQTWFEINTNLWSNGYDGGLADQGSSFSNTAALATGYNAYSVYWPSSSSASFYVNYGSPSTLTTDIYSSQLPIGGANTQGAQVTIGPFYWIRVRAYPPNGVMPSVSFGPVEPQITVFVNGVKDGNNGIASGYLTNITAFGIQASHIGLKINGTIVVPLGSASLSYEKVLSYGLYNITVFSNQSNLANQTYWEAVANIPKRITNFVPVSITNQQDIATSASFQQNVSVDSFAYHNFENQSLNNVEFFSPSGSTIPSWLQSGDLAYFDGTSSYANLPQNYPFGTASTFTITVWFKTTSDGVVLWDGNQEQISSGGCYSPIIYVNTNGNLAGGDWVGSQPFNTNNFVANGKWNFVTITQSSTEQVLYLNGNKIATDTYSSVASCSPAYWTIGEGYTSGWADTNNGNFYFKGYISNMQFYNQIFSASKVALLYDEGVAGYPVNNSGLIAWYMLSGNGNQQNGHNTLAVNSVQFNGVSSGSSSTNYWLKLGNIQPKESYIAFIGFALPNISLFNTTNDGEAPQLSSTYAQYDDGANVFALYFNGNTPTTDFATGGGDTVTQETGVTMPNGNTGNALRFTTGSSETATTVDMYTVKSLPNNPNYYITESSFQSDGSGTAMADGLAENSGVATSDNSIFVETQYNSVYFDQAYISGGSRTSNLNPQGSTTTAWRYSSLIYNSSSSFYGYIAPQLYSTSSGYSGTVSVNPISSITTLYWGWWGDVGAAGKWTQSNWVRVRAYPPNGVMPSETVGPLNGQAS